jgi:hypothetical protein
LRAVSLSGVERTVHHAPDWLVLHDISAEGRVLLSRNTISINMACKPRQDASERDLTWQGASTARILSPDGETVIFFDPLRLAPSGAPTIFRRSMDGAPAVPIGEGMAWGLSPDGKWVVAASEESLVLLPTGAGSAITLPKGDLVGFAGAKWLGDSKRIVFTGTTGDNKSRGYIQEIPAGSPRAITPEGVALAFRAPVRQDNFVLARVGAGWKLFPILGGDALAVPALTAGDMPVQWSQDGRYVYTIVNAGEIRPSSTDVFKVDLATGSRVLWKTLSPSDPVGVEDVRGTVIMTPDAEAYCYSYMRRLGDLFVVDGLK